MTLFFFGYGSKAMTSKISIKRRKQIKEALFDILVNDGIKKLSTKNLSEKAGISEGTLYRHFGSKTDIYLSIVNDVETELFSRLQKIALSTQSPQKRLKMFICEHYQYLTSHRGITLLLFSLASYNNNQQLLDEISQLFNLQKKYFCKIITDGMVHGAWDSSISPEKLSEFYMGIPTTLNIELNLEHGKKHGNKVCMQIYTLIIKILEK